MDLPMWQPDRLEEWNTFRKKIKIERQEFIVSALVDNCTCRTLIDTGCTTYGMVSEQFVQKHQLERVSIPPRKVDDYTGETDNLITEVARFSLDVGGIGQPVAWAYIAPRLSPGTDLILGLSWMEHQQAYIDPNGPKLCFKNGVVVNRMESQPQMDIQPIGANAFALWNRQKRKDNRIQVFAASMKDIEKALRPKVPTDPRTKLPPQYHEFLPVFDRSEADKQPPHRGPDIDHKIELNKNADGTTPEPPWGPLYNMSRDELLVLRKTLTELLEKNFIRVSNSPAAAPVLLVKKPGGGLRFCVDYRALNAITKKDRYPLPLINETLERVGKARWFTKLDVIAAFHKIRIAAGDEWLTAFRTRFGLFEWLVTPFGLANAPSTFQRYVNWVLRDFLDEFTSAYLDDILVFTDGTLSEHQGHVRKVLGRLQEAGLQIDIDKCEFEVKSTKYLGFIIEAGKGVSMDPAKVEAIMNWAAPTTVKGVRSFLGFANFYRRFIRNYSELTVPLTALTQKDKPFIWDDKCEESFQQLKRMFTTAPILMQFNPDRETVVETDSSGWATGGVLSQYDNDGVLRPCAYFSKKNTPAECNYQIHDKELLAIINALKEWESELMSVVNFQILTDHRNLRYFTTTKRLNERQMRWADLLSQYDFTLHYRPGKLAERPDALSRREQDVPVLGDERLKHREQQLFNPEILKDRPFGGSNKRGLIKEPHPINVSRILLAPVGTEPHDSEPSVPQGCEQTNEPTNHNSELPSLEELQDMTLDEHWARVEPLDKKYSHIQEAVQGGAPQFPRELGIKASISECSIEPNDRLCYRGRRWVPNIESLRTRLLQETHDTVLTGHPGRSAMYAILAQRVYWPGISEDVRRFVRNCDKCSANNVWRDRRQGLLKPLPIPDQKWRYIAIDFIEALPVSSGCKNIMVIVDRLGKGVIPIPCEKVDTYTVAQKLIQGFIGYHGIPASIVSDRGTQFVNGMWKRFCELLGIKRQLSTAYHAETDGQTERMNATIELFLRSFCDHAQSNWASLLPMAQLAICSRDATSTGVSPFFLDHGYHVEPFQLEEDVEINLSAPDLGTMHERGERIAAKLKGALDIATTELAVAQQRQEDYANRRRDAAPEYQVGQKVWLDLRNIRTERPSKKLGSRQAKFTVLKRIGSHAYCLNTPNTIHNVFHTALLRPAATDPFPSQQKDDYQPPAEMIDGNEEYAVEQILDERFRRWGRGERHEFLVKYIGWQEPEWNDAVNMEDTTALDDWEAYKQTNGIVIQSSLNTPRPNEPPHAGGRPRRRQGGG